MMPYTLEQARKVADSPLNARYRAEYWQHEANGIRSVAQNPKIPPTVQQEQESRAYLCDQSCDGEYRDHARQTIARAVVALADAWMAYSDLLEVCGYIVSGKVPQL